VTEETRETRSYGWILVTALISVVVGVSTGVLVGHLNERLPGLEYELIAPAVFTGEKESIGVLVLNVSNPAKKEIENVTSTLNLGSLELREPKVIGLQPGAYSQTIKDGVFEVDVPYLNPEEAFSVQLLVASKTPAMQIPKPIVRAKGLIGVNRTTRPTHFLFKDFPALLVAASSALLAVTAALMFVTLNKNTPKRLYTVKHKDDERDIVAFILGIHGFHEEAKWARSSDRRLSYWSEADRLTEIVLQDGNKDKISKAVTCLECLLNYADVDPLEALLIHFDIARLAVATGDEASARKHLAAARGKGHEVIEKRLIMDDKVAALANTAAQSLPPTA
jgi:hypothetical protein